ncbi:MAG TPA: arylamine N-acetyltransferase [Bryobacteraceae bacterium]|nr:arylamine N-acetyltransferase [Bryobacteraceae bacterium]
MEFDLDAYFKRIGFNGARAPSLETLAAVHKHHTRTIAFENLDPFLRRPFNLDLASLQRKLVQAGRGGYCFEQNLLLSRALREIGFEVTDLAGRVVWNATGDAVRPRSHMLLLVRVHGRRYIADVGFGGQTLTSPLRLESDVVQVTPHESYRLLRLHEKREIFEMQSLIGEEWKGLYRFDLQEQFPADYEVTSWYLSNHPQSPFINGLVAARADHDCRYTLRNSEFAVHHLDGYTVRKNLGAAAELRDTLEDVFRIAVADIPELDEGLERVVKNMPR